MAAARSHIHIHTHSLSLTHKHKHKKKQKQKYTKDASCAHGSMTTYVRALVFDLYLQCLALSCTHTHTHKLTNTHTHTQTHKPGKHIRLSYPGYYGNPWKCTTGECTKKRTKLLQILRVQHLERRENVLCAWAAKGGNKPNKQAQE
jgi:hypothetical protein